MVSKPRPASYSVHYSFVQRFKFTAKEAYEWSMDYRADDFELMGKSATRKIDHINNDTIMLTDAFLQEKGRPVVKRRLIRMYPELLMMVNTRVSADNIHSQFLYQFEDDPKGGSLLRFTGSHVFYGRRPTQAKIAALASEMKKEDSGIWVNLNEAMNKDLGH
ncbi:MAG: hypothetical protein OK456_01085 [Thaumarchaeota archaeon]|nr:hypothetical protein [Nitrososphaerota archaeon]